MDSPKESEVKVLIPFFFFSIFLRKCNEYSIPKYQERGDLSAKSVEITGPRTTLDK